MASCAICSFALKRGQTDCITCAMCNSLFHLKCVPLKQEDVDRLKDGKKIWSCKSCLGKQASPSLASTNSANINLILSKIESLSSGQSKLINLVNKQNEKLESFENKLSELSLQITSIKEENNLLRNNLNTLTKRLEILEINRSTFNEDSFSDFIDRQARSKNIILFNVSEVLEVPDNNNKSDTSTVNLILKSLNADIKPVTVRRLGKSNGKTRPLKVTLNNTSEVFKILGLSRHLKSNHTFNEVRITSDKTLKQREYFKNLRTELSTRRSNGEFNLSIKYHKGVPSIVSSTDQKN